MKTLVTGASGFIGRHLVKEDNVALVRRPSGFSEEIIADILDKHSLESCCDGIDLIIHCAGFARETGKNFERLHWQINFEGTKNIEIINNIKKTIWEISKTRNMFMQHVNGHRKNKWNDLADFCWQTGEARDA